jgi:broad specificity phosphatase PhoE
LETAQITFSNLDLPISHPFIPQVKEFLREAIGIHTCDRRRSKSYIQSTFPNYTFEPGFPEHDPLWKPDVRETDSAQEARLKELLDDIFTHDQSTFISLSSHSGSIGALLRALKHRPFRLVTGAVIPVLVRAERIYGEGPSTRIATSTSAPPCTVNPTASAVV